MCEDICSINSIRIVAIEVIRKNGNDSILSYINLCIKLAHFRSTKAPHIEDSNNNNKREKKLRNARQTSNYIKNVKNKIISKNLWSKQFTAHDHQHEKHTRNIGNKKKTLR